MFANDALPSSRKEKCARDGNRKEKCARGGNKKKKGTQGVTKARSRLIRPRVPLIMPELPDQSLSFADVVN